MSRWLELYEQAQTHQNAAAGNYNHNIRVDLPEGPVNVRFPIHGADIMDLRIWREEEVLTAIAPYVEHAPRLLFTSADPVFQVHKFISGDVLNNIAPRGISVPEYVTRDVVQLFAQLIEVPRTKLPAAPDNWPDNGDSAGFGRRLADLTQWIYDTYRTAYADVFTRFSIPDEPLAPMGGVWPRLTHRPFACVHADVHRKNIIVANDAATFLDWELALWGDPIYDLAVHLHKMAYQPAEKDAVISLWLEWMPAESTAGWEHDLDAYLAHERIKSAIVDTVRYSQTFAQDGPYPYPKPQMVQMMTAKLNAARTHWGTPGAIAPDAVEMAFRARASNGR